VTNPSPGYEALVNGALRFAGIDQGIDFTGTGTVHAIADGVIERLQRSGSGWPGRGALLVYRITSGPASGKRIYVAEDYAIDANLRAGSSVRAGQLLGRVNSGYPGIEVGWAQPSGSPVAPLNPNPHGPKPAGVDFNSFIRKLSGSAPPAGTSAPSLDSPASSTSLGGGCATTLASLALGIGAGVALLYGTGAPWPW
jgi:hypothetical protein